MPPTPVATASLLRPPAVSWSVLLVEDHQDSARVLSTLMRRRGGFYRVFHAATAAEATALYQSGPVDVIVSDLGLPDGSGLDLIRHLQTIHLRSEHHSEWPRGSWKRLQAVWR